MLLQSERVGSLAEHTDRRDAVVTTRWTDDITVDVQPVLVGHATQVWATCNRLRFFDPSRIARRRIAVIVCFECFGTGSRSSERGAAMNGILVTKLRNLIARHFGIEAERLVNEARFHEDLGADWLDRLELIIVIEDQVTELAIDDMVLEQIETVGDLMRAIEDRARSGGSSETYC
jgi:acyl carrier protein